MVDGIKSALFIIPEYPPVFGGGISTYYSLLLPALVRCGVKVTAIVGSGCSAGPNPYTHSGVRVLPLDQQRVEIFRASFDHLALTPDLVRHLAAGWAAWDQSHGGKGYDIVECTDWGLFFVPWLFKQTSPSLLIRLHGSAGQIVLHERHRGYEQSDSTTQLIEASLIPRAALRSTYSRNNQLFWKAQTLQDVQYCPPPYEVLELGTSCYPRSSRGLVVGRIQIWKGAETLCSALRMLGSSSPVIDWVGRSVSSTDGVTTYSNQLAAQYPDVWGSKVIPLPQEPPNAIVKRQASAAFVIVPSDWDVFNLTTVEAMAQGCVVICSQGAGAADLIHHGKNGFLFEAGNSEQLANQIRDVQNLAFHEQAAIGRAARQAIVDQLHPDQVARCVVKELEAAMALKNRIPMSSDLLHHSLSPHQFSPDREGNFLASLDRIDLKSLLRYLSTRMARRLLGIRH
jgi:glycosyltransferase involved in cell wall biosynthesis